ncbi:Uncharacterized protein HZ326_21314 [Fusarium oxysporum f. sp. albedinis]|nr:Uncharacterized protein HZ326_21314 [Fusarium oxysporum f. sp. albedinis]
MSHCSRGCCLRLRQCVLSAEKTRTDTKFTPLLLSSIPRSECFESNSRLRIRRPSPSNQSCPRKRQRQIRPARFGPPLLSDRPQSATSTATSIDVTKHPEAKESMGDGSE